MRKILIGKTGVRITYGDGWQGRPDTSDLAHIANLLDEGYLEGEVRTVEPNNDSVTHDGKWEVT